MSKRFLMFLCASMYVGEVMAAAAAGPPGSGGSRAPLAALNFTLENGMKVVAEPGAPGGKTALTLLVRAGWASDPPDAIGVAELTVGALCSGRKTDGPVRHRDRLRELGAVLESFVARDYAVLELGLEAPDALEPGLELLAGILRDPGLTPYALDAASTQISTALFATRSNRHEALRRALPVLAWGAASPAAGLPDPWLLRTTVAANAAPFFRAHYRPDRMVLVVAGASPQGLRDKVAAAFGSCSAATGAEAVPAPLPRLDQLAGSGRVGLVTDALAPQALALAFAGPPAVEDALSRFLLGALVAEALGGGATGSPFPPAGLAGSYFADAASAADVLGQALLALGSFARFPPLPAQLARARQAAVVGWQETLADPRSRALWFARSAELGFDPDLERALAGIGAGAVQQTAQGILSGGAWRAVAIAPEAERERLAAHAPVEAVRLLEPAPGPAREAVARGQEIIAQALRAQGDVGRLRAIRAIETRTDGTFYGLGTVVPIKQRTVVVPPALAYNEAVMYRHERYIILRYFDGEVQVDRAGMPTSKGEPEQGPLLLRQALFGPALALVRAHDLGLVRWLDEARNEAGTLLDRVAVLDPEAGNAEFTIRRADGALVAVSFDLRPLDDSREEHRYDEFRMSGSIRLPFRDETDAGGRPYRKVEIVSYSFPEQVEPSLFRFVARPDPGSFEAPVSGGGAESSRGRP